MKRDKTYDFWVIASLIILGLYLLFMVFAQGQGESAAPAAPATPKNVTLKVYARAYTYQQDDPWKTAEKKIQAAHPDVKFDFQYEGFGWADLRTKFLTAAAGGQAPDVVMTDIIWLGEYADGDLITDVTDKALAWKEWDDVAPLYQAATKWNGKIYGPWLNTDVRVMKSYDAVIINAQFSNSIHTAHMQEVLGQVLESVHCPVWLDSRFPLRYRNCSMSGKAGV